MNCMESRANTNAWMRPEKSERMKKGIGMIKGTRKTITTAMISPAMTFPNNRAETEMTFAISLMMSIIPKNTSRMPIRKSLTLRALKSGPILMKLPMYFTGEIRKAVIFHPMTTKIPSAMVREKWLVGERKNGTAFSPATDMVREESIGAMEKRFDMIIKINSVKTIDRSIFFLNVSSPVMSIFDSKKL